MDARVNAPEMSENNLFWLKRAMCHLADAQSALFHLLPRTKGSYIAQNQLERMQDSIQALDETKLALTQYPNGTHPVEKLQVMNDTAYAQARSTLDGGNMLKIEREIEKEDYSKKSASNKAYKQRQKERKAEESA